MGPNGGPAIQHQPNARVGVDSCFRKKTHVVYERRLEIMITAGVRLHAVRVSLLLAIIPSACSSDDNRKIIVGHDRICVSYRQVPGVSGGATECADWVERPRFGTLRDVRAKRKADSLRSVAEHNGTIMRVEADTMVSKHSPDYRGICRSRRPAGEEILLFYSGRQYPFYVLRPVRHRVLGLFASGASEPVFSGMFFFYRGGEQSLFVPRVPLDTAIHTERQHLLRDEKVGISVPRVGIFWLSGGDLDGKFIPLQFTFTDSMHMALHELMDSTLLYDDWNNELMRYKPDTARFSFGRECLLGRLENAKRQ